MENTDLVVGEFLYRPGGRERRRDTGARLERKDMPTLSKRVGGGQTQRGTKEEAYLVFFSWIFTF